MRVQFIAVSQNAKTGPSPDQLSSEHHAGRAAHSTRMAATLKPAPSPCTGIAYPTAWWEDPRRRSAAKSRRSGPVVHGAMRKPAICRDTVP